MSSLQIKSPSAAQLQRYDYLYKIILIGDQAVGKSNLTLRFSDNEFIFGQQYMGTIGEFLFLLKT